MPTGVGPVGPLGEVGEREGEARVGPVRVVHDQLVLADLVHVDDRAALADGSRATPRSRFSPKRIGLPCSSGIWFASLLFLVAHGVEGAVVEDVAVLVDLDEGRALVLGGGAQHLGDVCAVGVHGARDEGRLGAERERERVERVVL